MDLGPTGKLKEEPLHPKDLLPSVKTFFPNEVRVSSFWGEDVNLSFRGTSLPTACAHADLHQGLRQHPGWGVGRCPFGLAVTIYLRCPCHRGFSPCCPPSIPSSPPACLLLPQPFGRPAWSWRCPSAPSKDTRKTSVSCHSCVRSHSHHSPGPLGLGKESLLFDLCRASSWGFLMASGGPAPQGHITVGCIDPTGPFWVHVSLRIVEDEPGVLVSPLSPGGLSAQVMWIVVAFPLTWTSPCTRWGLLIFKNN